MERTLDRRQWLAAALVVLAAIGWSGVDRRAAVQAVAAPVPEVSVEVADAMRTAGALMIDVRAGVGLHVPGALLIPLESLAARIGEIEHARTQPVVVYCGNGSTRGPDAVRLLAHAGFTNVVNLGPGFSGWKDAGKPVAG